MRAHRLALAELRRLTSGRMLRLALVALILVPTIYAGLYLYANKDPYANLDQVPAAVVVEDAGTTLANGEKLQVGDTVAKNLIDSKSFDWHRVSREEAQRGVEDDEYSFALVVPKSFSADIASAGGNDPRQATLEQLTNDANGYLSHTISNQVVAQVTKSVAQQVSSTAASKYLEGFATIHTKITEAAKGAGELATGLSSLDSGAAQLATGTSQLETAQRKLADGASKLAGGARTASNGAGQLSTGATKLSSGLAEMDRKTASLPGATRQLADGANQLADGNAQIADGAKQLSAGAAEAATGADKLQAGAQEVATGNAKVATYGQLAKAGSQDLKKAREQNVAAIEAQIAALNAAIPEITDDAVRKQVEQIRARLDAQVDPLRTRLQGAGDNLDEIDTSIAKGSADLDRLAAGSQTLATKLGDLSAGIQKLQTGADTLSGAATKASAGATKLATGADQLASGATQLRDGVVSAHNGAQQLSTGATSLASGVDQLATGADQLSNGETQAVAGTAKLSAGAAQLKKGTTSAKDGAVKLRDGLNAGLKSIPNPSVKERQAAAQVVGNPVRVDNASQATAGSYGAGMAPFFTGLSLWIGAYVLFLLVRPLSNRALAAQQPAWRVAVSGWLTPALIGVAQGVLVLFLAIKGLGFEVKHLLPMLAFMAFVSVVYAAILQMLAARFGSVGKFLGLVLMVVQLVSAGGTFPWQTLPGPLQALHKVLPMSYAIDGLRHLMYGGSMAIVWLDVAVLAAFLVGALVLSSFAAERMRTWTPSRVKPDLVL